MQNDFQQLSIYHNKVYLPQVAAFLQGVHPDICSGHRREEENMLLATDIFVFTYPKSERGNIEIRPDHLKYSFCNGYGKSFYFSPDFLDLGFYC